jgi:hypothetical protein
LHTLWVTAAVAVGVVILMWALPNTGPGSPGTDQLAATTQQHADAGTPLTPPEPAQPPAAPVRAQALPEDTDQEEEADLQTRRAEFIEKLVEAKVFQKAEVTGTFPRLWVEPRFYTLDFDKKQKCVGVVHAFHAKGNAIKDMVIVYDASSKRRIGTFDVLYGLRLDGCPPRRGDTRAVAAPR